MKELVALLLCLVFFGILILFLDWVMPIGSGSSYEPPDNRQLATNCIQTKGQWVEFETHRFTCVYTTPEKSQ